MISFIKIFDRKRVEPLRSLPMTPPRPHILLSHLALIVGLQLLVALPASAKLTLLGFWNFDEARQDEYVASVKASQENDTMGEIASQMGQGKIENSSFEFGVDPASSRPYLKMIDKASKKITTIYLVVTFNEGGLDMEDVDTGNKYRVDPIDDNHMTLNDLGKKLIIPLRRIND